MADSYSWKTYSGTWSDAADWIDQTTASDPAASPPGAGDVAGIHGPGSHTAFVLAGPGAAGTLDVVGGVGLAGGAFGFAALAGGSTATTLDILDATVTVSDSVSLTATELVANGTGGLDAPVSLQASGGAVWALGGAVVQVAGMVLDGTTLAVAGGGAIGIGGGAPSAGTITVATGFTASGLVAVLSPLANDGSIGVTGGLEVLSLSGSGTVALNQQGASLAVLAAVAAGQTIGFSGGDTLTLSDLASFAGTLAGFAPGDTLFLGDGATTASLAGGAIAIGGTAGLLGTLAVADDLPGHDLLVLPEATSFDPVLGGGYESAVVLAANAAGTATSAPAGSGANHSYSWAGSAGGAWAGAGNWTDTTAGGTAVDAPGTGDSVSMVSAQGAAFQIVTGDAVAQDLTIQGDFALAGGYALGALTIGDPNTYNASPKSGVVALLAGADVTVSGQAALDGTLAVQGTLDAAGLTLGQATHQTSGSLSLVNGGRVRVGALMLYGVLNAIGIDGQSALEVGSAGGAAAGALTVDAGAGVYGQAQIGANLVLNGSWTAGTYTSVILNGDLSGTGLLQFAWGSSAKLNGAVAAGVTLDMASTNGTLSLVSATSIDAQVTDFDLSDRIDVAAGAVASVYDSGTGTIALRDTAGADLGTIALAGTLSGDTVLALPEIVQGFGTRIVVAAGTLQAGAAPAPSAGSGAGDSYFWTGEGGAWGDAANWALGFQGSGGAASVAPGVANSVTIGALSLPEGPYNLTTVSPAFQVVSGAGQADTLATTGNVVLSGRFDAGVLNVGTTAYDVGTVDVAAGSTLTAGSAAVSGGALVVDGAGAVARVAGTLTLADPLGVTGIPGIAVVDHGVLSAASLSITGGYGVLVTDGVSALEVGGSGAGTGGLVIDAGGTLASTVSDFLTVYGPVLNDGLFTAGTLSGTGSTDLGGAVSGSGTIAFSGTLSLEGDVAASQTLRFATVGGVLQLYDMNEQGAIAGFTAGDGILDETGTFDTASYVSTGADTGTLTLSAGGVAQRTLSLVGRDYAGERFLVNPYAGGTMVELAAPQQDLPCFAAGTRILTTRGAVAVEALAVGDVVVNPWGEELAVQWLGHRRIDLRRHPRPWDVQPVRVKAGAFAAGVPARDLRLSPDHAVFRGGALIPVRYLVNGASIVQEAEEAVTYWHVELFRHDVLLAEGLPCESYLDTGNRACFANGGPVRALHPDFAREAWATGACGELVLAGAVLAAERARLLARAAAMGHARTRDAGLAVLAQGRVLAPDAAGAIALPEGTGTVRLVSRRAVPAELRVADPDHRRLGVAVSGLWLDGAAVALDDPRLGAGWHGAEPGWRWTDGAAVLDASGARVLRLRLLEMLEYWVDQAGSSTTTGISRAPALTWYSA